MQPFLPYAYQNSYINQNYNNFFVQPNAMSSPINIPIDNILAYTQCSKFLYTKNMIDYLTNAFNYYGSPMTNPLINSMMMVNCNSIDLFNSTKGESQSLFSCENIFNKKEEEGDEEFDEGKVKEEEEKELRHIRKQSSTSTTSENGNHILLSNKKLRNEVNKSEIKKIPIKKPKKTISRNTKCPHKSVKHYAKNMCSTCYHAKGREKKAWNCSHITASHYALGLCQDCYQLNYATIKKEREDQ